MAQDFGIGLNLTNYRQRIDLRIALIAALALLLAQLGAMTHAYSHVPKLSQAAYAPAPPASHELCADCLNFAPLLAAAGAPSVVPFYSPPGSDLAPIASRDSLLELKLRLAFRSRAPPAAR
ncbi:MAG TPA: hypothetical protein VGI93_15255 [Steroidobacteraceae bacterium]